jgi:hypothetical protein
MGGFPQGKVVLSMFGTVTLNATVYLGSPYLTIEGPGSGTLIFNCTANADCINAQEDHFGTAGNVKGFRMGGFTLLGPGSGSASAVGLHWGDMCGGDFYDIQIDNFTGTNGVGLWGENITYFSENNTFYNIVVGEAPGHVDGNTKDIRFSVNAAGGSGNTSFMRTKFFGIHYATGANQTTIAMDGGTLANEMWWIEGNTTSSTGTVVVEMSGSTYPSSGANTLFNGIATILNECTGCSGARYYSIPSGYTFDNFNGLVSGGTGFNYSAGMSGTLHYRLNPNPLGTYNFVNYSATGIPNNEYNIVINNPGSNRNLSISDPDSDAAFVFDTATQTLTNKNIAAPVLSGITNGTGLQLFSTSTTCTTGVSIGAVCTTSAITLPVAYADTNYRLACTGLTPTNVPIVQTYEKSNTTFTITIAALTAAAATFVSYDCSAAHN